MQIAQLFEALKPSQYRDMVKGWDKTKYEDIFKRYTTDKKHYRIYIPIGGNAKKVAAPDDIMAACAKEGYVIEDYVAGIASKDEGKRKMKIGKILARSAPELAQKFANDPKRQASKESEYYVVISRHPYDIAGMSTDRGWTSCMNLGAGTKAGRYSQDQRGNGRGVNAHYVPIDIKQGSIVAYLVKNTDKNINAPLARMLIKPFVDVIDPKKIAFGIQDKTYGTPVDGFETTVKKWVDDQNQHNRLNGLFELDKNVYNDGGYYASKLKKIGEVDPNEEAVYERPSKIEDIEDPSERLQLIAVRKDNFALMYIKNPTEKVIRTAIDAQPGLAAEILGNKKIELSEEIREELIQKTKGRAIGYMKHQPPSEKLQLMAVKLENNYRGVVSSLGHEPSEAVQVAAVEHYPRAIEAMKDPSKKVRDLALKGDGSLIQKIDKPTEEELLLAANSWDGLLKWMFSKKMEPSEEVMMATLKHFPAQIRLLPLASAEKVKHAIAHDGHALEYILHRKNLPPDFKAAMELEAVKQNGLAIKWIEKPSKAVQMAAVKQDVNALEFIKNPVPQAVKYAKENGYSPKEGAKAPPGWDHV